MTKGSMKYVPKEIIEELQNTKIMFNVDKEAECFKIIARNSKMATELKINLNNVLGRRRK